MSGSIARACTALFILAFTLLGGVARAEPLPKDSIPDPLKSWVPWVLHGDEEKQCPFYYNNGDTRQCSWPSRLTLNLNEKGGTFSLDVLAFRTVWMPLPGDAKHWPQQTKLDGKPVPVVTHAESEDMPGMRINAGNHTLTGTFEWSELPENLPVPNETGLLSLTLNGVAVATPKLDEAGRLWLKQAATSETGAERIEMRVNRLVSDDIPMTVSTRIELIASGKSQEVVLPNALLPGFIPLSLESALPARVERDGSVRVQVRPGRWQILLRARNMTTLKSLSLPKIESPIAAQEEVWAFEAHSDLRLVTIEGVPAVDPQQTTLPPEWKRFPAYRMAPGDAMQINQTKRGDPEPAPDRLVLMRNIWLDFDGGGYTMQDHINGNVTRAWRLEMAQPQILGRAEVDGADQYITRMEKDADAKAGIELRRGQANIVADSRLAPAARSFAATGWAQDFNQLSARLHLPPGWQLLHATGVDRVPGSWMERWTLLDFFLVLIITLACGKMFGWPWAGVALVALALSYHEGGAPQWLWLNLLAVLALLRVLPDGKPRKVLSLYRWVSLLMLVVLLIPFAVNQVRHVLYPVLERPWATIGNENSQAGYEAPVQARMIEESGRVAAAPMPAPAPQASIAMKDPLDGAKSKGRLNSATLSESASANSYGEKTQQQLARVNKIDPNAKIQTGPGLPSWRWNDYDLNWSGPVEAKQQISLWFISPAMNTVFTVMRLVLLGLLLACLANLPLRWPRFNRRGAAAATLAMFLSWGFASSDQAYAADMPSPELLKELKEKILMPAACLPHCASVARLKITVSNGSLQLRLEAHAEADTMIPLPGGVNQWSPERVLLDGKTAPGLARDAAGNLWVQLPQGVHQISLEASLSRRDTVQLPLPLKPHHVEADLTGWTLDGLGEDGAAGESLVLNRAVKEAARSAAAAENAADNLPPFVRVERILNLGLTWEIITRVVRASNSTAPILIEIPLIEGESVTNSDVRVQETSGQRVALVNLGPQTNEFSFDSALRETQQLSMKAPTQTNQIHTWRLNLGTQWHATLSGIPVIHHVDSSSQWLPQWQPWPGEEMKLAISKPKGVEGQTLTLDRSRLDVRPGIRATDTSLFLSFRSSRGGQHVMRLPEAAVLQSVTINGQSQPIRLEGREIRLPVAPGKQDVVINWRDPSGIAMQFVTPEVHSGASGVNSGVSISLPHDRWPLFVGGPRMGPAVLFWGVVIVLVLVAFGLGKVSFTPLKWYHWLLLGLGLTQTSLEISAVIVGWFFALGLRKKFSDEYSSNSFFNVGQVILLLWTFAALIGLFWAVKNGLLGIPEMQIVGNGSQAFNLNWYQDRTSDALPVAWVISVPLLAYRLLMLAWALWLAYALLQWMRWAWECYSDRGYWRKLKLWRAGKTETAQAETPAIHPGT